MTDQTDIPSIADALANYRGASAFAGWLEREHGLDLATMAALATEYRPDWPVSHATDAVDFPLPPLQE